MPPREFGHRPFLALSPRLAVLSPPVTAAEGPLNDVVVTTTRIRRHGCHNDVVAAEPTPPRDPARRGGCAQGRAGSPSPRVTRSHLRPRQTPRPAAASPGQG